MDGFLSEYYNPVSKSQATPLETVIRWGGYNRYSGTNSKNINNHTATTYGFSKNRTMYVATANGYGGKLQFMKLNEVKQFFNGSSIKGVNPNHSGFYNLKL